MPTILLGVLEGSTVMGRVTPQGALPGTALATTNVTQEALFVVSGLSAGSHTWDAAYAVQTILASTGIKYGGPNDTTSNNAYGGLQFEIWETPGLLGSALYDPSTAVTKSTSTALAMTALDTTNLRITFTAPSSGNVMVRLKGVLHGTTTWPQILLGVLDGATVRARTAPIGGLKNTAVATAMLAVEGQAIVTGLTASTSYTWDAAYGVETLNASSGLKYGGPNDAVGNDAFGAFQYEIWSA